MKMIYNICAIFNNNYILYNRFEYGTQTNKKFYLIFLYIFKYKY